MAEELVVELEEDDIDSVEEVDEEEGVLLLLKLDVVDVVVIVCFALAQYHNTAGLRYLDGQDVRKTQNRKNPLESCTGPDSVQSRYTRRG